jgi:hypothetical protein
MTAAVDTLPPTTEVFSRRYFEKRHPDLLSQHRIAWALRHRRTNGLMDAGAVFESPCGELLIHEPKFLAWFLGLAGRSKPRRARTRSRAVAVPA